jgi:hypothetical protein
MSGSWIQIFYHFPSSWKPSNTADLNRRFLGHRVIGSDRGMKVKRIKTKSDKRAKRIFARKDEKTLPVQKRSLPNKPEKTSEGIIPAQNGFLRRPWWQGVAGIAQILAAIIAIIAMGQMWRNESKADRLRREAARPIWVVNGFDDVKNEHGKGFRIRLINAGGAAVTVQDVGFREGVKGCWVLQPAFPYSVPVGGSTQVIVTCLKGKSCSGDVLLEALSQAGEITVHKLWISVDAKVRPNGVVGGGVDNRITLIAAVPDGLNAMYPRPVGNLPP